MGSVCCGDDESKRGEDTSSQYKSYLERNRIKNEQAQNFKVEAEDMHRHKLLGKVGIYPE